MKFMIASDIHGSAFWCEKLLNVAEEEKPEMLILLGDLLYHGPRNDLPDLYAPKQVIDALNSISDRLICVKGNCEAEVDQMVLRFPVLSDSALLYLNGLRFYAQHGHHLDRQNPPEMPAGSVILFGHTHIPEYTRTDRFLFINPGSVSIPKNGTPHSCIILDEQTLYYRSLQDNLTYKTEIIR